MRNSGHDANGAERLVIDASALAEYLVSSSRGESAAQTMDGYAGRLHIPHLAIVETVSVLRGWEGGGHLTATRAEAALVDLASFPAKRWPAEPFLKRIWELRHNVSAYDAIYVALAEELNANLLTGDSRLARAVKSLQVPVSVLEI